MKPYGTLVEHNFRKTTVIGGHVFFKGRTQIGEQLLQRHKQEEAEKIRKAHELQAQEGMSATDLIESTGTGSGNVGTIPPALREDGPTPEAWVRSGYDIADYPPTGYAAKPYEDKAAFPALLEKIASEKSSNE